MDHIEIDVKSQSKHSTLGKLSFILAMSFIVCFILMTLAGLLFSEKNPTVFVFFSLISLLSMFSALILSIIDLIKANRRKLLPIISLLITGPIGILFLIILFILTLYQSAA